MPIIRYAGYEMVSQKQMSIRSYSKANSTIRRFAHDIYILAATPKHVHDLWKTLGGYARGDFVGSCPTTSEPALTRA